MNTWRSCSRGTYDELFTLYRRIPALILSNFNAYVDAKHTSLSLTTTYDIQAGVYFDEIVSAGSASRYVPRSVQIDLETGVCDSVRAVLTCHFLVLTIWP